MQISAFGSFGARDGTRTHTAKPHAPQTCLSTIPTLSQDHSIITRVINFVNSFTPGFPEHKKQNAGFVF